jgi:toxin FitB
LSRGILDTSVLIADDVAALPGELAISVVSLAELHFGVLLAVDDDARARRLSRLSAMQRQFDPLPVDEAVAESYALLSARVVKTGRQPRARVMDLLIAATAHAHDAAHLLATHTISGGSKDLSRSPLSESTQRTQLPEIAEVDDSANPQGLFDGERNLQGAETIGSGGGRLAVAFDGGREAADDDVVEVIAGVHFD